MPKLEWPFSGVSLRVMMDRHKIEKISVYTLKAIFELVVHNNRVEHSGI